MSGIVTFDSAPPPDTVNMGIGQPSADLLPLERVREASAAFFAGAHPIELNYGPVRGDQRFLESLASLLTTGYASPVDPDSLFLSAGNSQALDFVTSILTRPGDTVFVEEPSYFLAFQIFRDHGLNIVGIPIDEHGLSIEHLRAALAEHRPSMLYTIPSFHNPAGVNLSEARRRELVELGRTHDFFIVADEVYQLLYFYEPPPPALGTMITDSTVVSLGSFSKILAPAMRLGWVQCAPDVQARLLGAGLPNSGGSLNHFSSHIARCFIDLGFQRDHLERVRSALRTRSEAMDAALQRHFDGLAQWHVPTGGYFYWLEFDKSVDTAALKRFAAEYRTGFQAGAVFSSQERFSNCLRLAFSHYNESNIGKGVERLRRLFDSA